MMVNDMGGRWIFLICMCIWVYWYEVSLPHDQIQVCLPGSSSNQQRHKLQGCDLKVGQVMYPEISKLLYKFPKILYFFQQKSQKRSLPRHQLGLQQKSVFNPLELRQVTQVTHFDTLVFVALYGLQKAAHHNAMVFSLTSLAKHCILQRNTKKCISDKIMSYFDKK